MKTNTLIMASGLMALLQINAFAQTPINGVRVVSEVTMEEKVEPIDWSGDNHEDVAGGLMSRTKKLSTTYYKGEKAYNQGSSYSSTWDVSVSTDASGTILGRGAVKVVTMASAKLEKGHGYAAAGASGEAEVKIGGAKARAIAASDVGVAHQGSSLEGRSFTIGGTGLSLTTTLQTAGSDSAVDPGSKTDATHWVTATSAVVNLDWKTGVALKVKVPSGFGSATVEGSSSAESQATVSFKFKKVNTPDTGGGEGTYIETPSGPIFAESDEIAKKLALQHLDLVNGEN